MAKIVVTKPTEYVQPRKICPACEGKGRTTSEPATGREAETGLLVTVVIKRRCTLCKGSGVLGKEARA